MLDDLKNLPSKGPLRELAVIPANAPTYIATHDTAPPKDQVIHTDSSTAALIRIVKKSAGKAQAGKGKQAAGADAAATSGKRAHEPSSAADGGDERPAKKAAGGVTSGAGGAAPAAKLPVASFTAEQLKAKTIPQLKELLKARGLAVSGAKDELIRRIVDHQRANKCAPAK
ncbi:hypothetical protein HYH02_013217 [Chlamydomonas schloesseri]|uniref:SAP domain-containing protein n=1 Tax=Chlamydomonas schloesseri TaxID=2026947 RepID=A0A835T375_9CHLO|nr:hypothetical protein HYH02_013217 [Chlamydomonas schloesseri]|eukprot:KAG2431640.1 hypothetical protein HYH02_013217 [Chlamydomonas schloesseri]